MVHVLKVTLKFTSVEQRAAWKAWWSPLADRVKETEPGCLVYELYEAEEGPGAVIWERYVDRAALDGPHQATLAAWRESGPAWTGGEFEKVLEHFTESGAGFVRT